MIVQVIHKWLPKIFPPVILHLVESSRNCYIPPLPVESKAVVKPLVTNEKVVISEPVPVQPDAVLVVIGPKTESTLIITRGIFSNYK